MSLSMRIAGLLLSLSPKSLQSEQTLQALLRKRRAPAPIPRSLRRTMDIAEHVTAGHPVVTITPRTGSTGTEVIYIPGGAYVSPLVAAHWRIVADIIDRTGATVTVPYYGLAPQHTVDEGYAFLDQVVNEVETRADGRPLFLAGDSSGAALALGLAMRKRDAGAKPPAALILFSPWVDATLNNPAIQGVLPLDPMLAPDGMRAAGAAWAGERDARDPLVSPLYDSLVGLPPMSIYQGARDILAPDAELFAARAREAGADVEIHVYPDAFHDFVGAGWTPEAKDAFGRVAAIIAAG